MNNTHHLALLITNAAVAKIYAYDRKNQSLSLLKEMQHEESRMKVSEITSDALGRYQKLSVGEGTYQAPTNPKDTEAERFAEEISKQLDQYSGQFNEFFIIAPGQFQAYLKKKISTPVQKKIKLFLDKDYTKLDERKIIAHLTESEILF